MTTDTAGPDADTTDGLFQLVLDLTDMADGESVRVRAYETCRPGTRSGRSGRAPTRTRCRSR